MTRTILTPKRRQLTRAARRQIDAMVETWRRKTGAWSSNGMMGLSIRTGMLRRQIIALAFAEDRIPTGVIQVPDLPAGLIADGHMSSSGLEGFTVDLHDLRQLPGRFVNTAQPRCAILIRRDAVGKAREQV